MHILWYLIESLLEDEESQRKGAVIVYYCLEKVNPVVPKARVKNSGKTNTNRIVYTCCHAMPLKIASVHGCNNDPRLQPFFDFALFVMANTTRVRFRFHAGKWDKNKDKTKTKTRFAFRNKKRRRKRKRKNFFSLNSPTKKDLK